MAIKFLSLKLHPKMIPYQDHEGDGNYPSSHRLRGRNTPWTGQQSLTHRMHTSNQPNIT